MAGSTTSTLGGHTAVVGSGLGGRTARHSLSELSDNDDGLDDFAGDEEGSDFDADSHENDNDDNERNNNSNIKALDKVREAMLESHAVLILDNLNLDCVPSVYIRSPGSGVRKRRTFQHRSSSMRTRSRAIQ